MAQASFLPRQLARVFEPIEEGYHHAGNRGFKSHCRLRRTIELNDRTLRFIVIEAVRKLIEYSIRAAQELVRPGAAFFRA